MAGKVVVDDRDSEAPAATPRVPPGWFAALAAVVVLVLVMLPGQPDPEVPPTSVTFPQVQVEEDEWRAVDLPGGGTLHDVAAVAGGGYLAVGDGPQLWSYDGDETWEWVLPETTSPGTLAGVAAYRSGAIAVGVDAADGVTQAPLIWRTATGGEWERVSVEAEAPAGLDGVFASGAQVVAWGWQGSTRDLDPDSRPLLLRSVDGQIWSPVDAFGDLDRLARLFTVTHHAGSWYAGGYANGRPALWHSDDGMGTWARVDTPGLPFGWAVEELTVDEEGGRVLTLRDLSEGRARRWVESASGWESLDEAHEPVDLVGTSGGETVGVGNGRLWIESGDRWEPLDLTGQVQAAADGVVVGSGPARQPRVWLRRGGGGEVVQVPAAGGGRWKAQRDLGQGTFLGAWPVGDGWVVGGSPEHWWYVEGQEVETFPPPWGQGFSEIVPAGEEWVALPTMDWTSNGVDWEARTEPWAGDGAGSRVAAVAEIDGRLLAVGRDSDFLWNVSVSGDGGRSWTPVDQPAVTTPLRDVAGIPDGFVATAARSQGAEEVVASTDGRSWETVVEGHLLFGVWPPTAVTGGGALLTFDDGEIVRPPRADATNLVRDGNGLIVVAGGRMWVEDGGWVEIPLDPPHGMGAGWVHPLPTDDRLLAVGADRGRLVIYEWVPG